MFQKDTDELDKYLTFVKTEDQLDQYLNTTLLTPPLHMVEYMESLCKAKRIKKSELIKNTNIPRTYAYQILSGLKSTSRDNLLQLCINGGFSLKETNRVLTLANYNKLYSQQERDSIIIFGINKQLGLFDINSLLYQRKQPSLGDIKS